MQGRHCFSGFIFLAVVSAVAYASSDYSCAPPRGTIFFRSYESCNSVPFLSPANDSRLNLELMLIDAGKLTGTLNRSQEYPPARDVAWLVVPFNRDEWELRESTLGTSLETSTANRPVESNEYAQGEGSRCSHAKEGLEAFRNAVNAAAGLSGGEAQSLIAARTALAPDCVSASTQDWKTPEGVHSTTGREFAAYIAGANAFYAGDFDAASNYFKTLGGSANPWLKETSVYMVGRTLLNGAQQKAFGEWGDLQLAEVGKGNVKAAEDAFNAYLREFPRGMYAASARGLLRRVYWLGNDQARLAEAFDQALSDSAKGASNVTVLDLVQEANRKFIDAADSDRVKSPRFLVIIDLMRMRTEGKSPAGIPAGSGFTLAELETQKDRFASNPALYDYLVAVFHMYVDGKPEQALALLPGLPNGSLSYFAFSQQTMRVLALEAGKQYEKERKLLLQMLPLARLPLESEQVQLMLARLEQRTGHVDRALAPESAVQGTAIRTILVEYSATAEMLRQRAKDAKESTQVKEAAVYVLLYKELTGRKYQAFHADLALVPTRPSELLTPFVASGEGKGAGYQCPSLREVAATLQREPSDAQSLNCVGELVRIHGVHYGQDAAPSDDDLGSGESSFPITKYSRLDSYLKVIANRQAEGNARAYALFRAVRCYEPAGNNACGEQQIPTETRKQWFQMLHKEYAGSVWAQSLKYYW